MTIAKLSITCILFLLVLSCASAKYTPPAAVSSTSISSRTTATVDKPFDEVWTGLIEFASSTFFGIDTFEKDSGLLTLSFGAKNAEEFVDCGEWESEVPLTGDYYRGSYVGYTQQQGARLDGKMNVFLKALEENKTFVRVNARYVFTVSPNVVFVFDSGGDATLRVQSAYRGMPPTRTCRPTYEAEREIIDWVKNY